MKSSTKLRPSAAIAAEIRDTCSPCELRLFVQDRAIDSAINRHRTALDIELAGIAFHLDPSSPQLRAENHDLAAAVEGQVGWILRKALHESRPAELASLLALRDALEGNPALAAAKAKCEPLFAELAASQESESAAAHQAALAAAELRERLEAEKLEALAEIDRKYSPQLEAIA